MTAPSDIDADLIERARPLVADGISKTKLRTELACRYDTASAVHDAITAELERIPPAAEVPAVQVVSPAVPSPPRPSPARRFSLWPLVVCSGGFIAIWSGWVELGRMTGFGVVHPFPGIPRLDDLRINTAITLPLSLEAYAAYALRVATRSGTAEDVSRWARRTALWSLAGGILAQTVLHLMVQAGWESAPWPITVLVSAVPVAVVAMFTTLWHKVHAEGGR